MGRGVVRGEVCPERRLAGAGQRVCTCPERSVRASIVSMTAYLAFLRVYEPLAAFEG